MIYLSPFALIVIAFLCYLIGALSMIAIVEYESYKKTLQ
jgi:hypothetical protein